MKKVLSSNVKIRFQDCDPFNHLNNSRYIDYMVNAREDQIEEHYGLHLMELVQTLGKSWVVASNQIRYIKPAFLYENVVIQSKLIRFSTYDLLVEMQMWDETRSRLKSVLWSNFTFFDLKSQRKSEHPEDKMLLFKSVVSPVEQSAFEERCLYLISKSKEK